MTDEELLQAIITANSVRVCTHCRRPNDRAGKMCSYCIKLRNDHQRRAREKRKATGKCTSCGRDNDTDKVQCSICAMRYASHRQTIKREVMDHYGKVCQCCGEHHIEFLTIDHINGDGAAHRRHLSAQGGQSFYIWLRANGYPPGFQVLCFNCNAAKGYYGRCPHKEVSP